MELIKPAISGISWPRIKEAYLEEINDLVPDSKEKALTGFKILKEEIKTRLPQAVYHPELLHHNNYYFLVRLFRDVWDETSDFIKVPDVCWEALRRVIKLVTLMEEFDQEVARTGTERFLTHVQMLECFKNWLINTGWQVHLTMRMQLNHILQAQKQNDNLYAIAILVAPKADYLFKNNVGAAIIKLIDVKNSHPTKSVAIAVPADEQVQHALMPYTPYLLKIGIRIFMVTATDEAVEIKE